jgi:2-polyprenyl-3-methyl-5-hydroxy-6-metoxy-1,4-benzoquinol methylase
MKNYLREFYGEGHKLQMLDLDDDFILLECNICKLIYQKYLPDSSLMECLYNSSNHITGNKSLRLLANNSKELEYLISLFQTDPRYLDFLDFGMGWGDWCKMSLAYGCNTYGIEFSQLQIDHARKFGINVITENDLQYLKFDYINTEQVFEHITNPMETLRLLKNALKKGGIIKISVPDGNKIKKCLSVNNWKIPKGQKYSLNPVAPLEHINCFNHSSLKYLAYSNNLKIFSLYKKYKFRNSLDYSLKEYLKIARNLIHFVFPSMIRVSSVIYLQAENN